MARDDQRVLPGIVRAPDPDLFPEISASSQHPGRDERKKKRTKKKESSDDLVGRLIAFLASESGIDYDPTGAKARELVQQRMRDGYTAREIAQVIRHKCREWRRDDKMRKYMRPSTLFRAMNFEQYLAEARTAARARRSPGRPEWSGRPGNVRPGANGEARQPSLEEARAERRAAAEEILADPEATDAAKEAARRWLESA